LDLLVALQVAGGVVLLTGAWLFVEALGRAASVNPGFTPDHALSMTVNPSLIGYSEEQATHFYRHLLERMRALQGVEAAALAQSIPLGFGIPTSNVAIPGGESQRILRAHYNVVDGDFFPAMGTRLLRGRAFGTTDSGASGAVIIVNESLGRTLFPGQDPIGKRVCLAAPKAECREVVGLAEQGKYITLAEPPAPYYWIPFAQSFQPQMTLLVRAKGEPSRYASVIRGQAATLEPNIPVIEVKTLREHMRIPMLEPQIPAFFLTVLSTIGLVLSLVGIVGVTSYSARRRTREIGIRMAIGARRGDVLWLILRRALQASSASPP
jgi:hypothetical protein